VDVAFNELNVRQAALFCPELAPAEGVC